MGGENSVLGGSAEFLNNIADFVWLGGRDSNPDNGVQSAVSYR